MPLIGKEFTFTKQVHDLIKVFGRYNFSQSI